MSGYTCDCDEEEIFDQLTAVIIIILNYAAVSTSVVKSLQVLLMVLIA